MGEYMSTGRKTWKQKITEVKGRAVQARPLRFETTDDRFVAVAIPAVMILILFWGYYGFFYSTESVDSASISKSNKNTASSPEIKNERQEKTITFKGPDGNQISAEELLGYPPPKKPKRPKWKPIPADISEEEADKIQAKNDFQIREYKLKLKKWKVEYYEYQKNAFDKLAQTSKTTEKDKDIGEYLSSRGLVHKKQMQRIWNNGRPISKTKILQLMRTYRAACGEYPPTENGLQIVWGLEPSTCKNWTVDFIVREVTDSPKDKAWNIFKYKRTKNGFAIYSFGADSKQGGNGANKDLIWTHKTDASTLAIFEKEQILRFQDRSKYTQKMLQEGIQDRSKERELASFSNLNIQLKRVGRTDFTYSSEQLRNKYKALLSSDIRPIESKSGHTQFVFYEVTKNSFFFQLGIKKGDKITELNSNKFQTRNDFNQVYRQIMLRDKYTLTILSNNKVRKFQFSPK